jgi:hypothetical protein
MWPALIKLIAPLIGPFMEALYKIFKDIARGNPAKRAKKGRDAVKDGHNKNKDKWRGRKSEQDNK